MVNDRQMKLTLAFSAEYARSIRTGQAATVSIASAMSEVSGTVSSVETTQQISSAGVRVIRVGITVNNPGSLAKGMTATATINAGRSVRSIRRTQAHWNTAARKPSLHR